MRLKPKQLGNQLPLDDYNACQYLLYQMDCWDDEIELTPLGFDGNYCRYTLDDINGLFIEDKGKLTILKQITDTNNFFRIKLSEQLSTVPVITYKLSYRTDELTTNATLIASDTPDISDEIDINNTETTPYNPINTETTPNTENTTKTITGTATRVSDSTLQITFPKNSKITQYSVIDPILTLTYTWDTKPYIDVKNGRQNDNNEILLDKTPELQSMINNTPRNNTKIIYRLDANNTIYYPTSTLIIPENAYIEIRGGTNSNAILDGTYCNRMFIVQPGSRLNLQNITLQNCNANHVTRSVGIGGAILVESKQAYGEENKFGVLDANNCTFQNCAAGGKGGAIASYKAGLYVHYCKFKNCITGMNTGFGGAIYYTGDKQT